MSWFTKIFSRSKNNVINDSFVIEEERKPIVASEYMRFYKSKHILRYETFAIRSLFTGKYMFLEDSYRNNKISGKYLFINKSHIKERHISISLNIDTLFKNFAEAYNAFCYLEEKHLMDSSQFFSACKSLIFIFNHQYSSMTELRRRTFMHDYPKYFRIVQLMLAYDLPVLIKADLYRQISMFKKSVELLNNAYFRTIFECELRDEIRFRACNNIRHPFMVYDIDNMKEFFRNPDRPTYLDWFFYVYYDC